MYFLIYSALAWEPKLVNGETVTWVARSIPYHLNTEHLDYITDLDIESAISAASDVWNSSSFENEESSFKFNLQGYTKNQGADFSDEEHIISFDKSWTQDPSLLAITHVWSDSNGNIVHFDIEVNIDDADWTLSNESGKHDLQNSMAHEFGHALGLEHSDDSEATMAPSTTEGEVQKRDLHQDDVLGVVSLYPLQEDTDDSPTDNSQNSNSGGSQGGGSIDNAITNSSSSGSGSGPVALEKSGCSVASTSALWLGILALFQIRRRK